MIDRTSMFRLKGTSNNPGGCPGTKMPVKFVVNTGNTEKMKFYIVTIEGAIGHKSLMYPKTTTPVKVVSGQEYPYCLDPEKTYLLVITDPNGGLSKIDRFGKKRLMEAKVEWGRTRETTKKRF